MFAKPEVWMAAMLLVYTGMSLSLPIVIPGLYRYPIRGGCNVQGDRSASGVAQSMVEQRQFADIVELWMNYAEHWIPDEWIVKGEGRV